MSRLIIIRSSHLLNVRLELSEYEAAALVEAETLNIQSMKAATIESDMTDTLVKNDKETIKKGNQVKYVHLHHLQIWYFLYKNKTEWIDTTPTGNVENKGDVANTKKKDTDVENVISKTPAGKKWTQILRCKWLRCFVFEIIKFFVCSIFFNFCNYWSSVILC